MQMFYSDQFLSQCFLLKNKFKISILFSYFGWKCTFLEGFAFNRFFSCVYSRLCLYYVIGNKSNPCSITSFWSFLDIETRVCWSLEWNIAKNYLCAKYHRLSISYKSLNLKSYIRKQLTEFPRTTRRQVTHTLSKWIFAFKRLNRHYVTLHANKMPTNTSTWGIFCQHLNLNKDIQHCMSSFFITIKTFIYDRFVIS